MKSETRAILFYDGECGLCSRAVRFMMRRDKAGLLFYAPLQGETAADLLDEALREKLDTVVYRRSDGHQFVRSDAILHALIDIRSPWRFIAKPCLAIPKPWRDAAYNWIAARRQNFFSAQPCPLPKPSETERLLP
jgi:predicted DCC family thiol-disulfide oxidoreductase YuxK